MKAGSSSFAPAALIFDQMVPMLWVFAASQLFWGILQVMGKGKNIGETPKMALSKIAPPHSRLYKGTSRNEK